MSESDTSSLVTLPASLAESLFHFKGQRRYASLNKDYPWRCDPTSSRLEVLRGAICGSGMYPNGLYYEPKPGTLEEVFASAVCPVRIVDLGCGMTASWCISMAQRFPEAEAIGVDMIPCDLTFLPPNLSVEIHDLLDGIPFPDEWFDLIHLRGSGHSARFLDHPDINLVPDIVRALKPGGVLLIEGENACQNRDPFCSRTLNDPLLEIVRARHKARTESVGRQQQGGMQPVDLLTRLRNEESLRGSIETYVFEHPIGARPEDGPPEGQVGTLVREAILHLWELMDVASGLDDSIVEELRTIDRLILPEHNQGLSVRSVVVWARKKRVEQVGA